MRKFIIFALVLALPARAQSQRTTCYDSGNTRICETFDSMGNRSRKAAARSDFRN